MRFTLKGSFKENAHGLTRKGGYCFQGRSEGKEEFSLVRPARGYPRFHIYLKKEGKNLIFNLHLDQKRPIYKGVTAHSGEYDGEVVEREADRIKEILK